MLPRSKSSMHLVGNAFSFFKGSLDFSLPNNTWVSFSLVKDKVPFYQPFFIKNEQPYEISGLRCYRKPQVFELEDKTSDYVILSQSQQSGSIIFVCNENKVLHTIHHKQNIIQVKSSPNHVEKLLLLDKDNKEFYVAKHPATKKLEFTFKSGKKLHAVKKGITWGISELKEFSCRQTPQFLELSDNKFVIHCDKDAGTRILYFQDGQLKKEFEYKLKIKEVKKIRDNFAIIYDDSGEERIEFPLHRNIPEVTSENNPSREIELEAPKITTDPLTRSLSDGFREHGMEERDIALKPVSLRKAGSA